MLELYLDLPWELRHHIHTFCVEGPYDNDVIVRRGCGNKFKLLVRHSTGPYSCDWIEDPIIAHLNPKQYGINVSREMLEAYYRIRIFKFSHDELECIQSILELDCLGIGIRPAEHIRHLDLQIQPFRFARIDEHRLRNKEETRCLQAIQSLAVLRSPRTKVSIHIDMAEGYADEEDREELFSDAAMFVFQLAELVNSLRGIGPNIALLLEGGWDETGEQTQCGSSMSCLNDCVTQLKIVCQ